MRRLPRPDSTIFRVVLSMALLAWAGLAFGVPSPLPRGRTPAMMQAHAQVEDTCAQGRGAVMADSDSHHQDAPGLPMGHGDCCHAGCHCLSAWSVALPVPFAATDVVPGRASPRASIIANVSAAMAAPPLRPPIA